MTFKSLLEIRRAVADICIAARELQASFSKMNDDYTAPISFITTALESLRQKTGENVSDDILLTIPATLRSGSYRIALGLYDSQTQKRLPVTSANATMPDAVLLDEIFSVK